jgi:hypothetical protein
MTTTARTPATKSSLGAPMDSMRRTALVVGVLFVITYITSIAAKFAFYPPFLENADYITGTGEDTRVLWGAFSEMILIFANIATAVALYPVLRRRFPALSLGFVTARVMESVFIAVGILSVLTLVTMRQDFSGAAGDAPGLPAVGDALVTLQEWTFNLGPGVVVGVGNGLLLGYMMYRTGLVPRAMAILGLVGGTLNRSVGNRRHLRGHRGRLKCAGPRQYARVLLGAELGRLPDREGFQARGHHRRDGGCTMTLSVETWTYGDLTVVNRGQTNAQPQRHRLHGPWLGTGSRTSQNGATEHQPTRRGSAHAQTPQPHG